MAVSCDNQISDISALSGLTNLTFLFLTDNQISDIAALAGMTNLTLLYLDNNQISNIPLLSGLTNLVGLILSGNQISDISPLSGLTNLDGLNLNGNQVSDISALSGMTNLSMLDLEHNSLNPEAYCTYLPLIENNNPGIDLFYDQSPYSDSDEDGDPDTCDNCPIIPNENQSDTYPPQGNSIGDACECEGNFNCSADQDVDGTDAAIFKGDFGRSAMTEPCIAGDTCNGDFNCDGDADGSDAALFKSDFGRSSMQNPCPLCAIGMQWCSYPLP